MGYLQEIICEKCGKVLCEYETLGVYGMIHRIASCPHYDVKIVYDLKEIDYDYFEKIGAQYVVLIRKGRK